MDVQIAETEQRPVATPSHVLEEALAGRDDLTHARGVDAKVVLADIDRKLAAWRTRQPTP